MINVLLTGVGGQGTVLASKILAQAAQDKGWNVRTAETIGMAQRGGSVVSHVRMGDRGEEIYSPLIARETADLIVGFEPAEAARALPFLSPRGVLVTATTAVPAVTSTLGAQPYRGAQVIQQLVGAFEAAPSRLAIVPDAAIMKRVGSRTPLNTALLAAAINTGHIPLTMEDLFAAVEVVVKPKYVDLNLKALTEAVA